MFESGQLPHAIGRATIRRLEGDTPSADWSLGNQLLMFLADTDDARGFKQWKTTGRHVRKGAKAFHILAPCTRKITDADEAGRDVERVIVTGFRTVPVFRVEDTEGELIERPDYTPEVLPPLLEVAERLGVPVSYAPTPGGTLGYYSPTERKIVLGSHEAGVFFHELAHAAHARVETLKGGQDSRQEIIAETVAAALLSLYGYGPGHVAWSRDYITGYASGKDAGAAALKVLADVDKVLRVIFGSGGS